MSNHTDAALDNLPFHEYASIMAARGAAKHSNSDTPKLTFEELVESDLTFAEIEAEYGEETAINAGIARDPDTWELTGEDFARSRPMSEVMPELLEIFSRRRNGNDEEQTEGQASLPVDGVGPSVQIDLDLAAYFRFGGLEDWQQRLNDTLRKAIIAEMEERNQP